MGAKIAAAMVTLEHAEIVQQAETEGDQRVRTFNVAGRAGGEG